MNGVRCFYPVEEASACLSCFWKPPTWPGTTASVAACSSPRRRSRRSTASASRSAPSKTLAVVGESGCGKSTLARQLTLIEPPTRGSLKIRGTDAATADKATLKTLRRDVQMVFQNPFASLNPRKTIATTLAEPLLINTPLSAAERQERVEALATKVGLRPEHLRRYPHMFSGGQRQRIAIARAMILNPGIVVADEPVSALDVSIQAQILNLFMDLQDEFGTGYVFISHNLSASWSMWPTK